MRTWTPSESHWIWLDGEERPANAYVQFRKSFHLLESPREVVIHASADCRYLLLVNGQVLGRGPVITDPKYKQVDVYLVEDGCLQPGENVLAALVLQRHNRTSRLYPVRGGFLLQLDVDGEVIGSDESWKARWADEYESDTPFMTHQYGNQEWCDGRKVPVGWERPGFDDRGWMNAVRVADSDQYWPQALEVRAVPHMIREIIHPKALVSYFGLTTCGRPAEEDREPARQILTGYAINSVIAWNADNIIHPENGPAVFQEQRGDGVGIVVDLGEEMLGYPFIDAECPAGVAVDIGHGEVLSRNRIQTVINLDSSAEQRYADRYITREGRQRFEIYDTKGCRYLEIHFNRLADFYVGAKIIIHEVGLAVSRPPFARVSEFESSDERLNSIWDICRRTALVKCQDWHICDAQREQNNWPEMFQDMLYWQCFGRVDMVRQMIHQFCRAQLPNGYIPSTFPPIDRDPSAITEDSLYILCTLMFPLIVYLDWLYGGEDERRHWWLECCSRVFDAVLARVGPNGTIANLPGAQWVEWTGLDARDPGCGVEESWELPVWNAMTVIALDRLSEMADALGGNGKSTYWRESADSIRRASTKRFWSDERQAYVDGIYDGEFSPVISQTTNALCILARFGSEERLHRVADTILDPAKYDVPSGMNMMAMYHEALQSLGRDTSVLGWIREKWGYMLDHGATTVWEDTHALETGMGMCFGFAGHPLNYLARTALGITPISPGYSRFSVQIVPHDLSNASGAIATPNGMIEIAWKRNPGQMIATLSVPDGCQAVVTLPRVTEGEPYSHAIVDGRLEALTSHRIASCSFGRRTEQAFTLSPGERKIVFE